MVPCVVLIYFHNCAWRFADEQGLTFRRYLRKHTVAWDDVQRVDWNTWGPTWLVVTFDKPVLLGRRAKFILSRTAEDLGAAITGRWTPEIVIWMMNQLLPAA